MELVEREQQESHLHEMLSDCLDGTGCGVVLDGAMGAGKTDLLNWATEHASDLGGLVFRAACSYAEQTLSFGVIDQLLRSTRLPHGPAEEVRHWLDHAAEEAPIDGPTPLVIGPGMAEVFRGLLAVLLELTESTPVIVGIDDVHCADTSSLHWLLYLIRRLRSARMMVVLTENPDLSSLHPTFRTELLNQQHCHRVELGLLSGAGVGQLLARSFDEPTTDRRAQELLQLSGGNPFLLHALIGGQSATGRVRVKGYGRAISTLLRRSSSPYVLRIAYALAILGDDASPERLAHLADVEQPEVDQSLRLMTAAGLLADGRFCHDAAALDLLENAPGQARVDLHWRAANMLHKEGSTATQLAGHLLAADTAPEPWAVRALLESAEKDQLDGKPQSAIAALELAYRDDAEERQRAAIATMLAYARWQSGAELAAGDFESLISAATAANLDDCNSLRLVRQLLWHGWSAAAEDVLAAVRSSTTDLHNGGTTAELEATELWISWTYPPLADRRPKQANAGRLAEAPGMTTAAGWSYPAVLLADSLLRARAYELVAQAEQVLGDRCSAHSGTWAEETTLLALSVLVAAGRISLAAAWCDRLLARSRTQYPPIWKALLSAARAEAAVRQGDLAPAVEHGRLALNYLPAKSWGVVIGLPLGSLILATTRMERFDEAAGYLARPVPEAMFQNRYGLYYLHARGQYYLATGHPHLALHDFQLCGELMCSWGIDVPGVVPWRTSAAETCLQLGDAETASRLLNDQLRRAGTAGSLDQAVSLRLLAASMPLKERLQTLTRALDLAEECDDQYERIRTLMELSTTCHQSGDNNRARKYARRARRIAAMCGISLSQAPPALSDSTQSGAFAQNPLDRAASLTESERNVATLAMRGYTNREIATKLFVSASTVEQHLTRVYRKLGVKGRKGLAVGMRQQADGQDGRCDPALLSLTG